MKKICTLSLISFLLFGVIGFLFSEENTYSVKGEIKVDKEGTLLLFLFDEETMKVPFTGNKEIVIEVGQKEVEQGKVEFEFKDVQPGIYGIRCFIDLNNNKKMDKNFFGMPKEPWGLSWQGEKPAFAFPPKFEQLAFNVDSDIDNIVIETEG